MQMQPNFMAPTTFNTMAGKRSRNVAVTPGDKARARIFGDVLFGLRDGLEKLAYAIRDMEIRSVISNATGNRVDIRVKIGGRTFTFHMCTAERDPRGQTGGVRTEFGTAEEAVCQLLARSDFSGFIGPCLGRGEGMIQYVQKAVTDALNRSGVEKVSSHVAWSEVEEEIFLKLYQDDSWGPQVKIGAKALHGALSSFLAKGGVDAKRNAHQTKRALDAVRSAAQHAFRHGSDIEEIMMAVRETLVKDVLES